MTIRDDNSETSQIVELTAFRGRNVRPILAQVEACWEDARRGRLVPSRSDIMPQNLQGTLAHVFVIERLATGLARFRIAGNHLSDLIGSDVRGMPISAIFDAASRENLSDALQGLFDDPSVVRFELEASQGFGRAALSGDMMLLPLRSDLGDISRALGVVVMSGDIGRTPRKLCITGQSRRGLTGFADAPVERGKIDKATEKPELRRGTRGDAPKLPDKPARAHLRLVADNTADA